MKYYNPYERIQTYYFWLINDDITSIDNDYKFGIPISRLHEITDIPASVIRKDFLCMFQWQSSIARHYDYNPAFFNAILEFDDTHSKYMEADQLYHLASLFETIMEDSVPPEFEKLLTGGALDDIPIHMENNRASATYHLSLSREEASALQEFNTDKTKRFKKSYANSYDIKDSYMYTRQYVSLYENLDLINRAIQAEKCLQIKYKTAKHQIISFYFKPLKIAYDSDENLYSILSIYKDRIQVHRLDHIISIAESDKRLETQNENLLNIYPNVWGNCFSDDPEQVKVKFYNEANVWNKVKKDLAIRTNGTIYEKNGFLYYEDIVYGISKFRSWIYGYGSSAIVLKPQSLRQQIIDSLKCRMARA